MSGPHNGKNVVSPIRAPEVMGESITFTESDPHIVPMMVPSVIPQGSNPNDVRVLSRFWWGSQMIQAHRTLRYYYRHDPRVLELEVSMDFGFPPSMPQASYSGIWMMEGVSTAPYAYFGFEEPHVYAGGERGRINWAVALPWERGNQGGLAGQLDSGADIGFDVSDNPSFSEVTIKQAGVDHLRSTLKRATKELAHQRGIGVVASQA